jgi:hypothetical protein
MLHNFLLAAKTVAVKSGSGWRRGGGVCFNDSAERLHVSVHDGHSSQLESNVASWNDYEGTNIAFGKTSLPDARTIV